jgi:chaperone required for assembly of F1-ATPase
VKRFYKSVGTTDSGSAHTVTLDGRPLKTPKGAVLALPTLALAQAIAAEWDGQGADIDQRTLPLTKLANTAVDHVAADREAVIRQIEVFARHDLVCYRAEGLPELAAREAQAWDGPLTWACEAHGLALAVTHGVGFVAQQTVTFERINQMLAPYGDFALAGFVAAAGLLKSVVLALALADGRMDTAAAHAAAHVDEAFQAEKWGVDAQALARSRAMAGELEIAVTFLRLATLQS